MTCFGLGLGRSLTLSTALNSLFIKTLMLHLVFDVGRTYMSWRCRRPRAAGCSAAHDPPPVIIERTHCTHRPHAHGFTCLTPPDRSIQLEITMGNKCGTHLCPAPRRRCLLRLPLQFSDRRGPPAASPIALLPRRQRQHVHHDLDRLGLARTRLKVQDKNTQALRSAHLDGKGKGAATGRHEAWQLWTCTHTDVSPHRTAMQE